MMQSNRHNSGFSLTELLVAMAIFLTVFAGVVALFSGAVTTVRQGYMAIEGFELGRGTLETLTQDLEGAFTARENGQFYQFYGRPEGFTFVGMLTAGTMGRVTYVVHPNASTESFDTIIADTWENVLGRARDQAYIEGKDAGVTDLDNWVDAREGVFRAAYPEPPDRNTVIDFPVRVTTYALLRFEENNVTDLNAFKLLSIAGEPYAWPYIDPVDPDADRVGDSPVERAIYDFLLTGLRPVDSDGGALGAATDMRQLALNIQYQNYYKENGYYLRAVKPDVIEQIIAGKRRELWIHILSEDAVFARLHAAGLPSFWTTKGHQNVGDYVLSERLRASARLIDPQANSNVLPIDMLFIPGAFSYGNEENENRNYFNDVRNIPGYAEYITGPNEEALLSFDTTLSGTLGAEKTTGGEFGSPLSPRIPAIVNPRFWIMREKPQPGSSDFRRWFSQLVDVPSGFTRGSFPRMTPNPN